MHQNFLSFGHPVVNQLTEREQIFENFGVVVPTDMEVLRYRICRSRGSRGWRLRIRGLKFPGRLKGHFRNRGLGLASGEAFRGHGSVAPSAHHCIVPVVLARIERVHYFFSDVDNHVKLGRFFCCWFQIQVDTRVVDPDRPIRVATILLAGRLS
jgi:hypothetical protein